MRNSLFTLLEALFARIFLDLSSRCVHRYTNEVKAHMMVTQSTLRRIKHRPNTQHYQIHKEWVQETRKTLLLRVLQCVAVCCSVLQCVTMCCSMLQCVAVCCSVFQCVSVCCNMLQRVVACCSDTFTICKVVRSPWVRYVLQCVAVCCSVLQCVAVCCSVWQCVAVCGSVL